MQIDLATQSANQVYHLLTQTLIPRPVAWVLTQNDNGSFNLAPFSYYTSVCSDPPLVLLSMGKKPDGSDKDTHVNITARGKLVIHIAHRELAPAMTETSRTLAYGDSELSRVGLDCVPFAGFELPRLAACRIAFACDLEAIQEIGALPQTLIFARVRQIYLEDTVVASDAQGRLQVDAAKVDPIGRLGANDYVTFGSLLQIPRPK